jgi:hypothetical protein
MSDDFFVGYLPMPPAQGQFLRRGISVIAVVAIALALLIAARQRDPGNGTWGLAHANAHDGVLEYTPYAVLRTDHGSLVIVNEGKIGAPEGLREFFGKRIRLHGSLIERPGRGILEVSAASPEVIDVAPTPAPSVRDREGVTLRGEIIDPKCFLGAMKPGDGKAHKACATLCLKGGVPPMFIERLPDEQVRYHLLVGAGGVALTGDALAAILPFVADDIELTGIRYARGELDFLELQPDCIHRR